MTTVADRRHLDAVAALGCVICGRPAEIHHVRHNASKRDHRRIVPLCPDHHRTGGLGVAVHAGRQSWEARWGSLEGWAVWVDAVLAGERPERPDSHPALIQR